MLEQIAYSVLKQTEQEERFYFSGNLENLSASVLYTGHLPPMGPGGFAIPSFKKGPSGKLPDISGYPTSTPIGSGNSGYVRASEFDLGPGIAKADFSGMVERIRKDDDSPSHLNYEYWVPGKKSASGKQKWINLANLHIDLEDDKWKN